MQSNIIIIACGIFKTEIDFLKSTGKINFPVIYVDSMLHMYPTELQKFLDSKIKEYKSFKIVLVFGDCHARMVDYEKNKNIVRSPGVNCCEIFLGSEEYKKLRKEGAFILLPEWAERWEEVFKKTMGFKNSRQVKPFMKEMHEKLVYIDTGYTKMNYPLLHEIADFIGLPLEIHDSSIERLETVLGGLLKDLGKQQSL